ncbi:hypothetical protein [Geodermatophilus sp. SYSU D00815]
MSLMSHAQWSMLLADCLHRLPGSMGPQRLGYLAATSKVEAPVRDELAFLLHEEVSPRGWQVCREWPPGRRDLAVVDAQGQPLMELEAKALYGFDAASPTKAKSYLDGTKSSHGLDVAKMSRSIAGGQPCYLLSLLTHLHGTVPAHAMTAVKYAGSHNSAVKTLGSAQAVVDAARTWEKAVAAWGAVASVEWPTVEVYEVPVSVTALLVGPLAAPRAPA